MAAAERSWTPSRARAVDTLGGPDGIVAGVAVDHRDSLRTALERRGLTDPGDSLLTALKLRIVGELARSATLVLVDAEYGAAQAIATGALPGHVALATPLEAQGYGDAASGRATSLLRDWTAATAARLGATACKLLLPYRVDEPGHAAQQEAVLRTALAACDDAGVALVLEPIVYGEAHGDELARLVVEGARRLASFSPDLLKVQYPGSEDACRALDEACGRSVPRVLLGGGADGETVARRVEHACRAGASGFIVGRTLWEPALVEDETASREALRATSRPLLRRLAALARTHGSPWRERVGPIDPPPLGWYR